MGLTGLDMLVLLLVGGGAALGFWRGFVMEVLSLMAWVAAILALKLLHDPVTGALTATVGTRAGAAVLAFALVFGVTFIAGKLVARRIGTATKTSAVGAIDRLLGGGFGAVKGLILATLLYLAVMLVYDTIYGRTAPRPDWIAESRTYPLFHGTGGAIVEFVERRRRGSEAAPGSQTQSNLQNGQ